MPAYRLTFRVTADDEPLSTSLSASDEQAAREAAAQFVAEALGHPDALVLFDQRGRFTIGAGFWSRSGEYSLAPEAAPAGRGMMYRR